ncbi:MAG: bifunctional UDP-3-O-[3-hydroxymyristoyl] N-acetylglucosamine deacetylase/3-hydroxyacyl-ACP dehydratase [Candidatus Glassbacteria bacterium]|nr:bifunctional UDP-3-O-[3-hydroxymyristoyl] N-acetylglucosamine deacetylase/3-hydroxyacyl-ACP dehydratase [Candidatus Glassbacteria bacterium]
MKQKTISRSAKCAGVGIHTGAKAGLSFKPAAIGTGIRFVRTDIKGKPSIPAVIDNVNSINRGTVLGNGEVKVHTVEHVLAAISGLGIDNLLIELDGVEVPAADGSSSIFVKLLDQAGIVEQDAPRKVAVLTEPFSYEENGIQFLLLPNKTLKISFHIEYPNPIVGCQFDSLEINADTFREYIAGARTFAFFEDVEQLKKEGLIKGGSLDNAVVIDGDKILNSEPLRSPKELVRHKILDLLGDLYLLGVPLRAHIISSKSGHPSNINLVRKLREQLNKSNSAIKLIPGGAPAEKSGIQVESTGSMTMGINQILERMPHRYPFLMVDRILEFEPGKRVVGIKNVTINEHFFQGHFPGHPIMPGVLIVEAMGQAGGLLMMKSVPEPENKVVYFMSLDKIKFRRPVFPGDQLRMVLEMLKFRHRICKMKGCGYVGDDLVAEAEMTAMVVDRDTIPDNEGR